MVVLPTSASSRSAVFRRASTCSSVSLPRPRQPALQLLDRRRHDEDEHRVGHARRLTWKAPCGSISRMTCRALGDLALDRGRAACRSGCRAPRPTRGARRSSSKRVELLVARRSSSAAPSILARSRRARGHGDGHPQVGDPATRAFDQGPFAGPRGTGDDEEVALAHACATCDARRCRRVSAATSRGAP